MSAYARAGCAAAHRCHSQPFCTRHASPTFASQTFWHAAFHAGRTPVCCKGMAWCAGNQCCCRHGGRRDGQWRQRCGASTRRAPSATRPPGYPDLLPYNTGYAGLSRDIQTYPQNKVIPGYPELSRDNPIWCLSQDNP